MIAVAESVTAGALSNVLCSDPGSSSFFVGGIITYSIKSKEKLLGIDPNVDKKNYANKVTTFHMAKAISDKFDARIGMATTGFSLPFFRPAKNDYEELNIENPYGLICLYDRETGYSETIEITFVYDPKGDKKLQRASVQSKLALAGKKLFLDYLDQLGIKI